MTAPGSTLTALNAGSGAWKWVLALEGYQYVFSDAPSAQVLTAWTGTDFTSVLTGCTFDLENEQRLDPWAPFTGGGRLVMYVPPQSQTSDPFGVDVGCTNGGVENILDAGANEGLDNDDTTATLRSTSAFGASGVVYIGTEAIAYTGKTATTLTGLTRGKYSVFAVDAGTRFGHQHRVRTDPNAVKLQPLVRSQPLIWPGKWAGLWLHRSDREGAQLNTKANARLVFAGRLVELRDDPSSMCTVAEFQHVLDYAKNAVVGTNLWSATMKEGLFIQSNWAFVMKDLDGTTWKTSNSITLTAGTYSAAGLMSALSDALAAEKAAARIFGTYTFGIAPFMGMGPRTYLSWHIPGAGPGVAYQLTMRPEVAHFLGDFPNLITMNATTVMVAGSGAVATNYDTVSTNAPLRATNTFDAHVQFDVEDERGTFEAQTATTLPANAFLNPTATPNAVFLVNNKYLIGGNKTGATISQVSQMSPFAFEEGSPFLVGESRITDPPVTVQQIFMTEDFLANCLARVFASTGTTGYNNALHDLYPASIGLAIPWEVIGQNFIDSVNALPLANAPITMIITKPTKLEDVFGGDLVLRWAFLRWKDGGLQFSTWKTPTTGTALSDANKAAPPSNNDNHRSVTVLSDEWQRPVIKINYDRDITDLTSDGGYKNVIMIEDRTAIDDAGGASKLQTINAVNTYSQNAGQGAAIQGLRSAFAAVAPLIATRAVRRIARTVDSRFFESIAAGDSVLFSDTFARNPDTGARGVTARPGIVVFHRWTLGGARPNADGVADINGEIEILFQPQLRIAPYVPAAQLDDTAPSSGYIIATKVGTFYAHKFSEASETADAARFTTGMKVRWIEMDAANAAAPSTFDDTVASQAGNTITFTTGFAAYDSSKRYILVFDTYGDCTAGQQAAYSFQADDVDAMVFDARSPFQYVHGTIDPFFSTTANAASDPVSLPADNTFGDAVGRDVATDVACNRIINNLLDLKTAHCEPWIQTTEMSGAAVTGTYLLVDIRPINLTADNLSTTVNRALRVAAFMKSSDGTSASVRVTLARQRPSGTTRNDVDRGAIYGEAVFTTTGGYAEQAAQTITIGAIKDLGGHCYLLVECTAKARTYGVAQVQEGARQ